MGSKNKPELFAKVADYYSSKLAIHGETPQGVDWNGEESQTLRFEKITQIIESNDPFSLNDLGCGYGALLDYLESRFCDFTYTGCDISEAMILAAVTRFQSNNRGRFIKGSEPPACADYCVASGIFNVRLDSKDSEWLEYLQATLEVLDKSSNRGFSFNCLTSYSDREKMRDYLYYADPCRLFDLCKRRYSRNVTLLHDYGLYEFTLLVRKGL